MTTLVLSKVLINKGLNVDLYYKNNKLSKNLSKTSSRTIGLSNESIDFLENIDVPCYKIASADVTNTPLQEKIAETGKPIILSTGARELDDVKRAYEVITKKNDNLYILHCTASYPANLEDMNLNCIKTLIKTFPNNIIGFSDHENGIDAASIAYRLGARIFEKHL